MFFQVCLILFRGEVPGQVHPPGPSTPWDQVHSPRTREIWSTHGRYASYWNAFLFQWSTPPTHILKNLSYIAIGATQMHPL